MTWPDGIVLAVGATTTVLILTHQHKHRSTTATPPPGRTEHRHDPTDTHQQHGEEDHGREEDHRGPHTP